MSPDTDLYIHIGEHLRKHISQKTKYMVIFDIISGCFQVVGYGPAGAPVTKRTHSSMSVT